MHNAEPPVEISMTVIFKKDKVFHNLPETHGLRAAHRVF